jgi:hypothetical protein
MRVVGYVTVVIGCLLIAVGILMAFFEILTMIGSNRARGARFGPSLKGIVRCVSSFSVATVGIGAAFVLVGIAISN